MPELPEVETFVRSLRSGGITGESIINRQIVSADLLNPRTLAAGDTSLLNGQTVRAVERRAKYILIDIAPLWLMIHLRMSGDLRCEDAIERIDLPHDRFYLNFKDGFRLAFNDIRRFGRIWITPEPQEYLRELGLEPLSSVFTPEWLEAQLRGKKTKIKALLLDQHVIAGIGNIYADESLYLSGIRPDRSAMSLEPAEIIALCTAIRATLLKGIEMNGASFDWAYKGGHFQNHFQVYQRTGESCYRCGMPIERIVIGQRGTHFCPKCQK